jgi:hypothetical protein
VGWGLQMPVLGWQFFTLILCSSSRIFCGVPVRPLSSASYEKLQFFKKIFMENSILELNFSKFLGYKILEVVKRFQGEVILEENGMKKSIMPCIFTDFHAC